MMKTLETTNASLINGSPVNTLEGTAQIAHTALMLFTMMTNAKHAIARNPSFALFFVLGLGTLACGQNTIQKSLSPEVITEVVPVSQSEAGWIVQAQDGLDSDTLSALNELLNARHATVRVLDESRFLMEVTGVELDELSNVLDANNSNQVIIEPNRVSHLKNTLLSRSVSSEALLNKMNPGVGTPGVSDEFSLCQMDQEGGPRIGLTVSQPDMVRDGGVLLYRGQSISFSGASSTGSSPLKYRWLVYYAPRTSRLANAVNETPTMTVTPDALGSYILVLIVKDAQHRCSYGMVPVGATYKTSDTDLKLNKRYSAEQSELEKFFPHLKVINALTPSADGQGIRVAVIDTGAQYNHPYLSPNILRDANQNIVGKNFVHSASLPLDDQGHGTHVSGLAAGMIGGVAHQARIIPIKALTAMGSGDDASIIAGIYWAIDNGAQIVNLSLGGPADQVPKTWERVMAYAKQKNVIIVAAAGNDGADNDVVPMFPTNFAVSFDNVISVAAVDFNGDLAEYSDYGFRTVFVAAPGGTTNRPLNSYDYLEPEKNSMAGMQGTSMAAPVVAGAAAAILAKNPQLTPVQVRNLLMTTGTESNSLRGKVRSERVINLAKALK